MTNALFLPFIQVHQNDIRPDLTDFTPRNFAFLFLSEDSPELFPGGDHQRQDAAVFTVKGQVTDAAQTLAIADVYHILFAEFTESHGKPRKLLLRSEYAGKGKG